VKETKVSSNSRASIKVSTPVLTSKGSLDIMAKLNSTRTKLENEGDRGRALGWRQDISYPIPLY
jgi:hypothetical protein